MQVAVAVAFFAVYIAMGLGRWPGFAIDRTGAALVGAVFVFAIGAVDGPGMVRAVDFSTLAILFSLMVVSAQVEASGFFAWSGRLVADVAVPPVPLLGAVIVVTGGLAAVLTNDVVVWALVPVVVRGVRARGLDARPFVIAMACAANAGSAATVIGNPQNLLIGQAGGLTFWRFLWVCGVPACMGLVIVFVVMAWSWRDHWEAAAVVVDDHERSFDRRSGMKALAAVLTLIVVFSLPIAHAPWALAVAAVLMLNRHLGTRRMLGMVDWHLLMLFACLFVVTGALVNGVFLPRIVPILATGLRDPVVALIVSLTGSNSIGNVPLVTALLTMVPDLDAAGLFRLAVFSTLAGNFLIVGSMANIIAVDRAAASGVEVSFRDYARIGVPVTVFSLMGAYVWLAWVL
ncbi:MAG: anion transporter [Rhodospirillaceae bacterium]|nr:anion transporter [Rhodospirillaceae bacterium]